MFSAALFTIKNAIDLQYTKRLAQSKITKFFLIYNIFAHKMCLIIIFIYVRIYVVDKL